MRLSRRLWCLALLGVVLLGGGCSTERSGSEAIRAVAPVTPPPPPGAAGPGAVRFTLDQYLPRAAQANDLDTVIKRLTGDCLTHHGLPWEPVERNDIDLLRHRAQRFGLADESLAEVSGYHWDPAPAQRPLSAAQEQLGCEQAAGRAIGWRADEWDWLRRLGAEATGLAWADPRGTAVVEQWSECMAEAGFDYARPQDAEADPRWWPPEAAGPAGPTAAEIPGTRSGEKRAAAGKQRAEAAGQGAETGEQRAEAPGQGAETEEQRAAAAEQPAAAARATAAEKRTAVADVRCKARVGLVEVLGTVLAEQQQRVVRENAARLDAFRRMADSAAARADTLRGDRRAGGGNSRPGSGSASADGGDSGLGSGTARPGGGNSRPGGGNSRPGGEDSQPGGGAASTPVPPGLWRTEHAPA